MGISIKHMHRKSKKGIVCPACGSVITDEDALHTIFGYGDRANGICPKCYTELRMFRNTETTYSSFIVTKLNMAKRGEE